MIQENIVKLEKIIAKTESNWRTEEYMVFFFVLIRKIIEEYIEYNKFENDKKKINQKTQENQYNYFLYGQHTRLDSKTKNIFNNIEKTEYINVKFFSDCFLHIMKDKGINHHLTSFIKSIDTKNIWSINSKIKLFYSNFWDDLFSLLSKINIKNIKNISKNNFREIYFKTIKNLPILLPIEEISKKNNDEIIWFIYGDSWNHARWDSDIKECFCLIQKDWNRYELI